VIIGVRTCELGLLEFASGTHVGRNVVVFGDTDTAAMKPFIAPVAAKHEAPVRWTTADAVASSSVFDDGFALSPKLPEPHRDAARSVQNDLDLGDVDSSFLLRLRPRIARSCRIGQGAQLLDEVMGILAARNQMLGDGRAVTRFVVGVVDDFGDKRVDGGHAWCLLQQAPNAIGKGDASQSGHEAAARMIVLVRAARDLSGGVLENGDSFLHVG